MHNQESFSRYDVYTTAGSLYCYRETGTLINRFNIKDAAELKAVEADLFAGVKREVSQCCRMVGVRCSG